jgi:hypothetical protein
VVPSPQSITALILPYHNGSETLVPTAVNTIGTSAIILIEAVITRLVTGNPFCANTSADCDTVAVIAELPLAVLTATVFIVAASATKAVITPMLLSPAADIVAVEVIETTPGVLYFSASVVKVASPESKILANCLILRLRVLDAKLETINETPLAVLTAVGSVKNTPPNNAASLPGLNIGYATNDADDDTEPANCFILNPVLLGNVKAEFIKLAPCHGVLNVKKLPTAGLDALVLSK